MTRQFFTTGEASHVAGNNDIYYGLTTGSQTVNIPAGVTGVVVNADVEQVNFAGNISDYKFLQQGNSVLVKNVAGTTVATLRVQGDTDGTQLKFGDSGVFNAILANGAVKVGGAAISNNDNGDVAAAAPSATPNAGTVTTPAYVITSSATSVDEGTTVTFTVTAAAAASVDRTFDYQIKGAAQGVAAAAQTADFSTTNGPFTIKANEVTGTILVTPLADNAPDDYYEGFNVSIIDNTFNVIKTSDNVVIRNTSYAPTENKLTVSATDVVTNPGNSAVTFIGQVGQTTTLQASDKVTGNNSNDTLRIVTDDNGAVTTASVSGFTVDKVNTLEVQAQASGGTTLGLENVNDLTALRTASSTNNLTLNNVNKNVNLSFVNTIGAANVTVNYTDAAVAGTADIQNIVLDNNTLGAITLSNTTTKATTHTGIETISIDTTGTGGASTLAGLTTAATVLNVKGNQNLTIGGIVNSLVDVNAASFTGKLAITAGTAATNITVVGGTNDDTIDVSAATGAAATQKVTTGTGNNTVILGATFSQVDSITGNIGVDTLSVTDISSIKNATLLAAGETFKNSSALDTVNFTVAQGADTFNADAFVAVTNTAGAGANAAGVNTYNFTKGLTDAVVLNKVADNITVGVERNAAGGQTLTLSKPTGVTAGTSTINFTNATNKLLDETLNSLTVASDATLKINATDTDTTVLTGGGVNTLTITTLTADAALTTLLVSGNEDVVLGNNLSTVATKLATITSTTTGAFTVNASPAAAVSPAVAQALTVTAAGTNNTITTGAGADVIVANGTKAITIQAGNGNNTVSAVGAATFATAITTGTGNDLITVTGNGTNTINTGITGDDIVTVTGTGSSTVTVGTGVSRITFATGTNIVNIAALDFTSTDTINGGTGLDTVAISTGAVALTDGSFNNLSSVEQLSLSNNTNSVTINQIANVKGLSTIILNGGTNTLLVGEGFVNPLTVSVVTNGNDNITATVNGVTTVSAITVQAAVASISANDTITGGSSTGDALVLTADSDINGANLFGVTNVETLTIKSSVAAGVKTANSATVQLGSDAVVAAGKTLTVDASDLTVAGSTFIFQGNAETTSSLTITGGSANNTIWGGAGADTITAGNGTNKLGLSSSSIQGGVGADNIILNANAGVADTVYYSTSLALGGNESNSLKGVDTIRNFTVGEDKIDLGGSTIAAGGAIGAITIANFKGNQSGFANVSNALNSVTAGDYAFDTTTNTLWVETDGVAGISNGDLQIYLPGVTALSTITTDVINSLAPLAIGAKNAYVNGNVATANYTAYALAPSVAIMGGPGSADEIRFAAGADISNAGVIAGFEAFNIDANATATMTVTQWTSLVGLTDNSAAGTQTVGILGASGSITPKAGIENYNASSAAGAITFNNSSSVAATVYSFTGSASNDIVNATKANLDFGTDMVYDGKNGTGDTLNVTDTAGIALTVGATITNVEKLTVVSGLTGQASTIALTATSFNSVITGASNDDLTVTNLAVGGAVDLGTGTNKLIAVTEAIVQGAGSTFTQSGTGTLTFSDGLNTLTLDLSRVSGFQTLDLGKAAGTTKTTAGNFATGVTTLKADTTTANMTVNMTAAQLDALATVTVGNGTKAFSIIANDVTAITVDLSDTTYTTLANVDLIDLTAAASADVTIDEDLAITFGGGADTLSIKGAITATSTIDLGAGINTVNVNFADGIVTATDIASTGSTVNILNVNADVTTAALDLGTSMDIFGTVNFNVDQVSGGNAVTINNNATIITAKGGDFKLGTGGDTFTASGTAVNIVTSNTDPDTFTFNNTAGNTVNLTAGLDTVTLKAGNAAVDTINIADAAGVGIAADANRVTVSNFETGLGGDVLKLDETQTTAGTAAAATPVLQVASATGALLLSNTSDITVLNFDMGGATSVLAGVLDGSALINNLGGALTASAVTDDGYILAYDNGNAYLYAYTDYTGAANVALIGVINGAAVGSLGVSNFALGA